MATATARTQPGHIDAGVPPVSVIAANPAQIPTAALTVDVEDYFQVEAFKGVIAKSDWENMSPRVEGNTGRVLDLFAKAGVNGTFFVLGWVAERFPNVVRRIQDAGHEVASHGYNHQLAYSQNRDVFRDDVRRAKAVLEEITGKPVRGYRAPTFSIRRDVWWVYDVLAEEGYDYSSSLYPVLHDLYGIPDAPTSPFRPTASTILEIPLSTTKILGRNFPCSGGGYFRLLPYGFSRWCVNRVMQSQGAYVFYCHPWEFDAGQPRINAGAKSRFRHYTNIASMEDRVSRLLREFRWNRMDSVFQRDLDNAARVD